jgi:DNA-binding HxlR family transcriptional regulator
MPDLRALAGADWIPSMEHCPVSVGVRLMGDRWSLLIVREILVGTVHFNELHRALPGLSRGLLASRLRYLQNIGITTMTAARAGRCTSYSLTPAGLALRPVLEALGDWALTWKLPTEDDDRVNVHLLLWRLQQSVDRSALPNGRVTIQFLFDSPEASSGWLRVGSDTVSTCTGFAEHSVDLTVRTSTEVMSDLWWGRRACEQTIADRNIIFDGPTEYARGFRDWFGNRPAAQHDSPVTPAARMLR